MKTLLLCVCSCIVMIALNSCQGLVVSNYNDLSMLRKGMDTATVDKIFDNDNLREKQTLSIANTSYTVKNILVLVMYIERTESYGAGKTRTVLVPVYNTCSLVFDHGKLMYWGFAYEYNMSDNPELRKIGALLKGFVSKEGN